MRNRIQELAEYAGADRARSMHDHEVASFCLHANGSMTVTLADGQVRLVPSSDDVPPSIRPEHRAVAGEMLTALVAMVPGKRIWSDVTYCARRVAVGDRQLSTIFSEAGR